MPNTPDDRNTQQPKSEEQRRRQQMNDKALEQQDDDDATTLRTEQGGETGEDEDLPSGDTEVNRSPGNFADDREKAADAGRKGGQQ